MAHETPAQEDLLARLTPSQRESVIAPEPRLAVLAGAGAGKTRVLTLRVARMVDDGIDPRTVLVVTFSRKAAQELRDRLWRLGVEGVRAGTFHRTALDLLETRRAQDGAGPPKLLTDRRRALRRLLEETTGIPTSAAAGIDTEISWAKGRGVGPDDYEHAVMAQRRRPSLAPHHVAAVFGRYEQGRRRAGMLDFDDLIIEATAALDDDRFAAAIHWRTRHLLVDEFQDVSPLQFELVGRLTTAESTLFLVGDPNQSIYGFNGADPKLLANIEDLYPSLRVISLGDNHRSTPEIVRAAAAVLPPRDQRPTVASQAPGRPPMVVELADDPAEAAFVARRILELHAPGGRWRSFAVLARTNAQLGIIGTALEQLGIPTTTLAPDLAAASDLDPKPQGRPGGTGPPIDAVALGTFHRSKGLEWPFVFVIGCSDGFVPHAAASTGEQADEERRLLYVALTRAEQELTVTWAARRDGEERASSPPRRRSPFLAPMCRELDQMEHAVRPTSRASGAQRAAALRATVIEAMERRGKVGGDDEGVESE
jgi:DNA helicase II / ATP-dependent DNA helicase PcrA